MSPEEKDFSEAIEAYEELLHSETQAIVAADLNKLDEILEAKDAAMQAALDARNALEDDPRDNPALNDLLNRVIEVQSRNAQTFDNLITAHSKDEEETPERARLRKVRDAYSTHLGNGGKRLEV